MMGLSPRFEHFGDFSGPGPEGRLDSALGSAPYGARGTRMCRQSKFLRAAVRRLHIAAVWRKSLCKNRRWRRELGRGRPQSSAVWGVRGTDELRILSSTR